MFPKSHSFDAEEALITMLAVSKQQIALCNITGCYGHRSRLPQHKALMDKLPFVDTPLKGHKMDT
eukprot:5312335-Pyramimonas_sp.AAC.1